MHNFRWKPFPFNLPLLFIFITTKNYCTVIHTKLNKKVYWVNVGDLDYKVLNTLVRVYTFKSTKGQKLIVFNLTLLTRSLGNHVSRIDKKIIKVQTVCSV